MCTRVQYTSIDNSNKKLHILLKKSKFYSHRVIHHSFATIHPYINTHLTHLIDCLVKCDELTVNMIGGSSHFDGYAPARQRPNQ